MNSPKIHPKHPINLALIVLTGLVALLGYTWRASSPNLAIQPVSTSTPLKHDRPSQAQVSEAYGKLPLRFEANQGQTDHQVKFISRGSGYNLFLTGDEAVLTLRNANHRTESDELHTSDSSIRAHRPSSRADTTLRMKIVGANPNPQVAGQEELPGKVNYFIGNDPKKWRTNIPTYGKVMYRDVYPGVDLVYYGKRRQLEYDFVLGPGADPNQIRLEFGGAKQIRIDEAGDLVLTTHGGDVRQHKPVVYQEVDGSRKEVAGSYVMKANREVGFEIGSYDNSQPLVIDPILAYSTYLGGTGDEIGNGIAVDSSGAAYVTGRTASLTFPTTSGAFQTVFAGSPYEVFVTKLNPAGNAVVYSTYLGGADFDEGFDLAVDSLGSAYVTGNTKSANFPTTLGAFQTVLSGGPNFGDAFVTKFSVAGDSLVYSTYLGGGNDDRGWGIALDTFGAAYVTGETRSSNFPLLNQFQGFPVDFNNNGFVTKLNTTGSALAYSTYLGGNSYDQGTDIAIDPSGKAYVTGMTQSTTFPTANAFQSTLSSAFLDAFVMKIDPALSGVSSLIYSTYLGGSDEEQGLGIAVNSAGNAYVTGYAVSTNFPTVPGGLQTTYGGGAQDAFVTMLSVGGNALVYSTYLGGSAQDHGTDLAVDSAGNTYVIGFTHSANFPTVTAFQPANGGAPDAFVTKLNAGGSALVYSSFLGGSSTDVGQGIALDSAGNAYVAGFTLSTNYPTVTPAQGTKGGSFDAFVAKIGEQPLNQPPVW